MRPDIKGWFRKNKKPIPLITTAAAVVILLVIYSQIGGWYYSFLLKEEKSKAEAILAPNGDNLNNALHRRFSLISGLNAYIQSYLAADNHFSADEFEHFSRSLYATISGTRKISVAPRGIISLEYPYSSSDSSIGLDLIRQSNPMTADPVLRTILTKKVIIDGPLKLDHARIFVTARQAVFDENGLWGLISFEYDLVQIMSESSLTLGQNQLSWGLFDEQMGFFFGDPSIADKDPVSYQISIPEGSWYLKAAPRNGWDRAIAADYAIFRNVSAAIILLLTTLVYVLSSQQTRLSNMVKVRTAALQDELRIRGIVEEQLQYNEDKFRSVFNQMSDMAILYHLIPGRLPGAILEVNDTACELLGFSREELQRLTLLDLELSENRVRLIQRTKESDPMGQGFFETEFLRRNGELLPVETRVKHFQMQDVEVGLIIARDITERITAEKNLSRANRALKVLIEFNESLVRAEREDELLEVLCNILVNNGQYDLAWAGFIDPETKHMLTRIIERSEKAVHLAIPEANILNSLPSVTDHSISLPLIIDEDIVGGLGIVLTGAGKFSNEEINLLNKLADDISYGVKTLRLRAETRLKTDKLRESEELYHQLARNIPNGMVMLFNRNKEHILADGLGLSEFGIFPNSIVGKTPDEIFSQDICELLNPLYDATLSGKTNNQEFKINDRAYEMHFSPIRTTNGKVEFGLNLIQDISEHKNLQIAIKHQQEEEQMILDSVPAFIFFKTLEGRVTWVNQPFRDDLSLPSSAILGKYDYEIFSFLDREYLSFGEVEIAATGQPQRNIIGSSINDNGPRWFKTDKIPRFNKDGVVDGIIGFTIDITAIKNAELEIQQLNIDLENRVAKRTAELEEKNRELETFSYSVSHDLKAPLRGISGYSQLLMENYSNNLDKEGMDFLFIIRDSVRRMEQLISDLLSYSRMERLALNNREINIQELIHFILAEYRDEIDERGVVVEMNFGFTHLFADGEGLVQVFRNLIGNAIKFTRDQTSALIQISGEETYSSWLISVKDNGIGIDMAHREKIFEIFQRLQTSEEFPGTGVGLAIVKKVVTRLGGKVWVESEKGKGATFIIEIMKGENGSL
jgi:PAS domain S-box-containing protein